MSSFIKRSTTSHQDQQKPNFVFFFFFFFFFSKMTNTNSLCCKSMGKKSSDVAQRAWNAIRLALLWVRKGNVFRRRWMMVLRLVPKYLKNLGHTSTPRGQIFYQERELSFDKTPIFHLKTCSVRFLMSCISSQVDFDRYDSDGGDGDSYEYEYDDNEYEKYGDIKDEEQEEEEEAEEEGIDMRAEKFIAQFYEQMRMQRQISYLEYNETPRSTTTMS